MGRIFLSYAREDRICAEALARVFEQAGHQVWWDRHLDSGEEFGAEIEAALGEAEVVVVAWSKESVKSRWVRDEAAVGGDTGRLVPVTIDGSLPPMGFRQFHTLDLAGWKGGKRDDRTAQLLHAIERRLKGKREVPAAAAAPQPKRSFAWSTGKSLWAVAAVLVLLIGAGTFFFMNREETPSEKPTMALLPFTTASSDAELRDLASQARDSIAHTLPQSGIPVRLIDAVPQDRRTAGDFLISGELSRNADKIIATVRLDEAAHGVTISSKRFDASGDDVRNLAERIGVQMAGALASGPTLMILDRRHPADPALLADLLAETGDQLQAYQNAKRVAAKAPNVLGGLTGVAFHTGFVLADLPRNERPQAVTEARRAADRAMALAPEYGDIYVTWCLLHSETRFAECEDQMRKGNRIDADASYLRGFLADFLRIAGSIDEAAELSRLSYAHDPYDPIKIVQMLRTYEFAGDSEDARKLYQQAVRWYPEHKAAFFRNRLWGLIARGDSGSIQRLEKEVGEGLPPAYRGSGVLAVNWKSAAAVRQACQHAENFENFTFTIRCMLVPAQLGDQDAAYAIAEKLFPPRVGRTPAETERIWLDDPEGPPFEMITAPAAAPMRRDPRYFKLVERTGLLAYWRSGRPPDFCRKQPEPICARLLKRN
jgi:TolB-like protein